MDESQVTNDGAYEATQPPAAAPEFNVGDLLNVRAIIDVAARRGAFGAAEMASVGAVFTKLDNFLNAVAPPQSPATDQTSGQG
jgi:hypothetical protein